MGKIVRVGPSERLTPHAANNAELPSGALYPDGLPLSAADPVVQSSVRPEGTIFVQSPGYESVRTGKTRFQESHGRGIGFAGINLAEDPYNPSVSLVDGDAVGAHAETGVIHPEMPYEGGKALTPVIHAEGDAPTVGDRMHRVYDTPPDMGDREGHRPLTRAQMQRGLYHPAQLLRDEWQQNPVIAVIGALAVVAVAYVVGHDLERSYRSRRGGGGVVRSTGAAPAAAVATAGQEAQRATETAADAVKEAGSAVKKVTDAAADQVAEKE